MFDLSWAELLVIFAVALIFIGPKDIPNIAYQIGKFVRRLKYMQFALTHQFDDFMKQAEVRADSDKDKKQTDKNPTDNDEDLFDEAEADIDLLEIMPLPEDENTVADKKTKPAIKAKKPAKKTTKKPSKKTKGE